MDPLPSSRKATSALALPPGGSALPAAAGSSGERPVPLIGRLIERTMQPFAIVDLEGRLTHANRAYCELTGYREEELLGMPVGELTPPRWREVTQQILATVRESSNPVRYEKEYRHKDGRVIPVEVAVDLHHDECDRLAGFYAFVTDISERKRAADALRESEERYRQLYDEAPVGYHEIDCEARIVNINRTECEMLGFSRDELLGRPVFELLPRDLRAAAQRAVREKFDGTRPLAPHECTMIARDGHALTVAVEERHRRDSDGRIAGILSTVQDITARKATEAALVRSERRARALFDGIEDAVFVHSPEGRILDANPSASRLLGYSHKELLALSTRDVDDAEFAAGYQARLAEQIMSGHLTCEGRHRTKYGRVIPVEITTSLIHFDHERAVLAVVRDISERKALEEARVLLAEAQARNARDLQETNRALSLSEERYRRLTEGCLDAVVVADGAGKIVLYNPAAQEIFGYEAEEILGSPLTRIIPPETPEQDEAGKLWMRDSRIVGKTVGLLGVRKSGESFPLELSLSAVDIGGDMQFIGSIRDQTERQRMQAMLVQQDKLASIGQLSAGLAHEINNPLAYVANNLAVLDREMKGVLRLMLLYEQTGPALAGAEPALHARIEAANEEIDWPYLRDNLERMLSRTREGVQRVANIVHSLRSLARTSNLKLEAMRLPDILESTLEMVRGRLRRQNVELIVEHSELPPLECVPSQIGQVALNLLINAAQAVETREADEGGWVRVCIRREGSMAVLEVSDNGCGIAPNDMPRLFDPFFTTKPVGEGTGLGLSISHGIVNAHGGRIEVESCPRKGTTFRVLLPLRPG